MAKQAAPKYLSLAQVSDELGISERTARRWIAAGRLTAVRLSERVIRVERAELDRFVSQATRTGAA